MEIKAPAQSGFSSSALRWSWVLVVACGLLLGYAVLQTYGKPKPRQYQLDFGQAKWIEPAESPAPVAYFRKEVYLSSVPEQAWLQIAASDNFALSVNGNTIASEGSVKTYETGIYDLKRALRQGTNVIGASIARTSFPGSAQLLLKGQITEPGGRVIPLESDESWRVTNKTGIVAGSEEWTSARIVDEIWPAARLSALNDQEVTLKWVDINPLLFQLPSQGSWIMADNAPPQAVFSFVVEADSTKQETWIQVASSGDLDLAVNGHIITAANATVGGSKQLPHLAAQEEAPEADTKPGRLRKAAARPVKPDQSVFERTTLEAYDISYWIRSGPNVVVAAVRNKNSPAAFFANGFTVKADGTVARFSTSASWTIGSQPTTGEAPVRAVAIGKEGVAPWGYLQQEMPQPLDRSGFVTFFRSCTIVGLVAGLVVAIWLIASAMVAGWRREPLASSMSRDALLHGPLVAGLLLLFLPNFDPRFPVGWSFQPLIVVGAFVLIVLLRLFHLVMDSWEPAGAKARFEQMKVGTQWETRKGQARNYVSRDLHLPELFEIPFRRLLPVLLLVLVMFLGLGLRYHNLGYVSFDHDEMGLVAKSKGIFKLGFPYTTYAGEVRPLTTYEAVPYPLAASGFLFGYSEWSMRLPACLMGMLCIGVIGLMGRRLFDWRIGLFAALVYACLPLNIRWAQNAFYLSQCQLMAMLTFWLFYEAIKTQPFGRKWLTAASVTFGLTYLSWEGTGFLLPALLVTLVIVRWDQWWWLKDFHLYRCLFFIGALIVAQYCSRLLAGAPYLQVGSGLSNLTGPSLFFLAPGYQPLFYFNKLLFTENHVFFTVMLVLGLPFAWRHTGFRYVAVLLGALLVLHTNFLAALSPRYCYYFQPLLLLGGVAATFLLYDRVLELARQAGNAAVARFAAHATGIGLLAFLFIQGNESILKVYRLSSTGDTPQLMTRLNTYRYDYRGAANYVMAHARPGDIILPGIPHVFNYYAGVPGDYFLDTLFSSKVPYNQLLSEPRFADKFGGLPVIRNVTELREAVHRAGRAWIIFAPYSSFEKLNSPAALEYIHAHARTQFESYRAKVLLIEGAQVESSQPAVAQAP